MDESVKNVSFIDLWHILMKKKKVLFICTLIFFFLGCIVVSKTPTVYLSKAYLLPPLKKDVQMLNSVVFRDKTPLECSATYSTNAVFQLFVSELMSRSNFQSFFTKHNIGEAFNVEKVQDLFVLLNVSKRPNGGVIVSFKAPQASVAVELLTTYIEVTSQIVSQVLIDGVQSKINFMMEDLRKIMVIKKEIAVRRRQDRIVQLSDKLLISVAQEYTGKDIQLPIFSPASLRKEVEVLKRRKDDTPYIDGFRDLQEKLLRLENYHFEISRIKVVRVDQKANTPLNPIQPKKRLTVALATFFGLMLGVAIVFIGNTLRESKQLTSEN